MRTAFIASALLVAALVAPTASADLQTIDCVELEWDTGYTQHACVNGACTVHIYESAPGGQQQNFVCIL